MINKDQKPEKHPTGNEPTKPCEWCDWDGKYSEGSLKQKKLWTGGAVDVLPLLDWTYCPNCGRRLK